MTMFTPGNLSTTFLLSFDYDALFLAQQYEISAADGIDAWASHQRLFINGSVKGTSVGIRVGDDATDTDAYIEIRAGGSAVGGGSGIMFAGDGGKLVNEGEVAGFNGVTCANSSSGKVTIVNSGSIMGSNAGISRATATVFAMDIVNTGSIYAFDPGRSAISSDFNSGSMHVRNSGLISGNISFSIGADVYDGRGGLVTGTIFGNGGNDRFTPGAGKEKIDAGGNLPGGDTLDLSLLGATKASLDGSILNTGNAKGDVYTNFENITGSSIGSDVLSGDDVANVLRGGGGNDTLFGRDGADFLFGEAGNDTLVGGRGIDFMIGAAGADRFAFNAVNEAGDGINGFDAADLIVVKMAAFGNLALGTLSAANFTANTSGLATAAAHRFIYETDVDKLWYDSNGNALGGRSLLVDIANDFAMTNADILVVL